MWKCVGNYVVIFSYMVDICGELWYEVEVVMLMGWVVILVCCEGECDGFMVGENFECFCFEYIFEVFYFFVYCE